MSDFDVVWHFVENKKQITKNRFGCLWKVIILLKLKKL